MYLTPRASATCPYPPGYSKGRLLRLDPKGIDVDPAGANPPSASRLESMRRRWSRRRQWRRGLRRRWWSRWGCLRRVLNHGHCPPRCSSGTLTPSTLASRSNCESSGFFRPSPKQQRFVSPLCKVVPALTRQRRVDQFRRARRRVGLCSHPRRSERPPANGAHLCRDRRAARGLSPVASPRDFGRCSRAKS
jgi:hypothetical protein